MAERAIFREAGRHVIRIGGAYIKSVVAAVAGGRKSGEVIVYVTGSASDRRVSARERERCGVVIKGSAGPVGGCVAD